jgi:hypothetical protein
MKTLFAITCPVCGQARQLCGCLLSNRHFLAQQAGLLMRGKAAGPATHRGDRTETPPAVCQWIADRVLAAGRRPQRILDPCAGNGNMNEPFRRLGCEVIEYELDRGRDFFDCRQRLAVDLVLANLPFSGGVDSYWQWLDHITAVTPCHTPIVLIVPTSILFPYQTSRWAQKWYSGPRLSAVTCVQRGIFSGVGQDIVICWFDLPELSDIALLPSTIVGGSGGADHHDL